jgi:DNA-binding MarR family transcriptional regulator
VDDRVQVIQRIIDCSGPLFHSLNPIRNRLWLSVELTMPQLKALICAVQLERATSGQIARSLGVTLPTITGIVDRLAEQDLVSRREDLEDRRVTRVVPTAHGRAMVNDLLRYRNEMVTEILSRLNADQLRIVETAFHYLIDAVNEIATDHQSEEEVA